jgi:hypothetical protein
MQLLLLIHIVVVVVVVAVTGSSHVLVSLRGYLLLLLFLLFFCVCSRYICCSRSYHLIAIAFVASGSLFWFRCYFCGGYSCW